MQHPGDMSSQIFKAGAALGLMVALGACGGGGGGGDGSATVDAPTAPTSPSTSDPATAPAALLATYDPPDYTSLSAIPTSGSATYDGYVFGDLSDTGDDITDSLTGVMVMDVTFTVSSVRVSGRVDDFTDDDDAAVAGSLMLSDGRLDRNGNPSSDATLLVTVAGNLKDDQGRSLDIRAQLEGDFLSNNHRAVGGEVLGGVTVDGTTQNFDGGFIGER